MTLTVTHDNCKGGSKAGLTAGATGNFYYGANNAAQTITLPAWTFTNAYCAKAVSYSFTTVTGTNSEFTFPSPQYTTFTVNKKSTAITNAQFTVKVLGSDGIEWKTSGAADITQTINVNSGVNTCTNEGGLTIAGTTNVAEKQFKLAGSTLLDGAALTWTHDKFTTSDDSTCQDKLSYSVAWTSERVDSGFMSYDSSTRTFTLATTSDVKYLGYHNAVITAHGEDGIAITTKTATASVFVVNTGCEDTNFAAGSVTAPAELNVYYTLAAATMSRNFNLWTNS